MVGTAIVTGASQGIGRAIACRLSQDGFKVALNDLPSQKVQLEELHAYITQQGGTSLFILADISVEYEVKRMVDVVVERMGGVDVMVAHAGICKPASFLDTTVEELQRALSVNVIGTFLCYKYAAQQMIKQGRGGRIIGASSVAGKTGVPLLCSYNASKFAVRGLTQAASSEFARYGITVNAYAPGSVEPSMSTNFKEFTQQQQQHFQHQHQQHHHQYHRSSQATGNLEPTPTQAWQAPPVGFDGHPDDIAGLVSYIASKESRFMTGVRRSQSTEEYSNNHTHTTRY